jgi:hypothetical protein
LTLTSVVAFVSGGFGALTGSGRSLLGAVVYGYAGAILPFCLLGLSRVLVQKAQTSDNPASVVRWSNVYRLMLFPTAPTGTEQAEASAHKRLGTQAAFINRLDRKTATKPFAQLLRAEAERDWESTKEAALAVLAGQFGLEEKLSALTLLARVDPGSALQLRFSTPGFRATELVDFTLLAHCGVETPVRIAASLGGGSPRTVQAVVKFRQGLPAEAIALLDDIEQTHELTAADRDTIGRLRTRPPVPFAPTEPQSALIRRLEDGLADAVRAQFGDGPPMMVKGRIEQAG